MIAAGSVTDEVWGRVLCHLCWTTGYFLLNRYSVWKSHGRRWPPDPDGSGAADDGAPRGLCARWLEGVARRFAEGRHVWT